MTQQPSRNPFTRTGALADGDPLFRGRGRELAHLEQACLHDHRSFMLVYGGRQTGKTSLLLRLEATLRQHVAAGVRVCRVDFQQVPRASAAEAYRHLARQVAYVVPGAPAQPPTLDAPGLTQFLDSALQQPDLTRLVLLLDELGTLPDHTRADLAYVLRGLHTQRLFSAALQKAQIVLAGGIELYNLAVIETSALNNVCEVVRLDDLEQAEAVALIRDGLALIGVDAAVGTELGQALYARVRGHPYLTQRIGAALAAQFLRGSVSDVARVEALCQELLETDDPLLGHLRRGVAELRLAEAVRWLLTGTQRITRTDDATARLELLGLARRERGCWQPRNPLFALALAEWLHIAWPAHQPLPLAAAAVRTTALEQQLLDLQHEQQALDQRSGSVSTITEQVQLQRRARELATEVAHLETRWQAARIPELIEIPAGPFLMGSSANDRLADDDEKPQHRLELPTYYIGKTPVTNTQFRPFVEGDGYRNPDYWTADGWRWREKEKITRPAYWDDDQWNGDNYPVVGISWFEAVAYCRWLSAQTGIRLRLPTEAEWEKAARGPEGRIWPWGNDWAEDRCNSKEASAKRTTPVGHYPTSASPYGVLDMAGNVWEWCATRWRKDYPYTREDEWTEDYLADDSMRIFRGGSWYSDQKYVRGAYRFNYDLTPRYRDHFNGLRLASHSLPEEDAEC